LALVAVIVGVPLGLVVGRVVWTAIAGSSNVVVHIDVEVLGLAGLISGVAAIVAVASIWPAYRAARLRPADALRTE
jgi:ABC-type antimicrobial peptide transport system permease subunit